MPHIKHLSLCALALAACFGGSASAAPSIVATGFDVPVFVTAPLGDSRLFVVEKSGLIKTWQGGGSTSTFLDIRSLVDADGERGLLGLAFDPNFATTGRFYVDYIDKTTHNTVVAAYTTPQPSSGGADLASARTILTVEQPADRTNHKGGWIGFRSTDPGQLYIATGDGGAGYDPENRAQNLNDDLGKLLRVTPLAGGGYTAPASNPLAGAVPGNDELWAWGLRNPYRASFDRQTGDLWIADVGQASREEIDFESALHPGGANYGWRALEGDGDTPTIGDAPPAGAVDPLYSYAHGTMGASIIGGYVYRGGADASLEGQYVFGDYVSGKMFALQRDTQGAAVVTELASPFGAYELSSFGEDGQGGLYAVSLNGNLVRIAAAVPEPATWATMAAGGLMLIALRRRRQGRA